jgi:hypothetical protein
MRRAVREWTPPTASNGMTIRMGRRASLMARRSSFVGFSLEGRKNV